MKKKKKKKKKKKVIPKSVTPSRIEENLHTVELSKEDFDKINSITTRQRTILGKSADRSLFPDDGDF